MATPLQEDWLMVDDPSSPEENTDADADAGAGANVTPHAIVYQSLCAHIARQEANATPDLETLIPRDLYDKAQNHQDQLTDDERLLLLSRGDAIGKALGHPDPSSVLTPDEVHEVMQWPPPAAVRANVERATGGRMRSPRELYEKAKDAIDDGRSLETMLSEGELGLLAQGFRDSPTNEAGSVSGVDMAAVSKAGSSQAMAVVAERMGVDLSVFRSAAMALARRRAPGLPFPWASRSASGDVSMPVALARVKSEEPSTEGRTVFSIPMRGQKRAHSTMDMETDDSVTSPEPTNTDAQPDGPPERPETITSLGVFLKDLGDSVGFDEALLRWEELEPKEQGAYEKKARLANMEAEITFQQRRVEWLERMRSQ